MQRDNQQTCSDWANASFGRPSSLLGIATRANEELAELIRELSKPEPVPQEAAAECGDVTIILYRLAEMTGNVMQAEPEDGVAIVGSHAFADINESPMSAALFAARHLHMLMTYLLKRDPDKELIGDRCCSIMSCMELCCKFLGTTLAAEVDRKMEINRGRTWNSSGDGHGYHVKPSLVKMPPTGEAPPAPAITTRLPPNARKQCENGRCIYSRAMNQPYPRKCLRCGVPEADVHNVHQI